MKRSGTRCGTCFGKGQIHAGGGTFVKCPSCTGAIATIGDALSAKTSEPAASREGAPTVLKFTVPGEPVGKERARVFRKETADGRVVTRAVTPEKTREYETKAKTLAKLAVNQARWGWSKDDRFTVIMRVFTSHRLRRADGDNVQKAILDSCNGVAWSDDRYVTEGVWVVKQDAAAPRVEVEIRRRREAGCVRSA